MILKTKAVDNYGYKYDVNIEEDSFPPVLHILTTPGRWYVTDLCGTHHRLAIDYGQKWYVENMEEIKAEYLLSNTAP